MCEKEKGTGAHEQKVWIFQATPLTYDVYSSLLDDKLAEAAWLVNRYKDEIHAGDIALIWKARKRSGIYAVGNVTTDPAFMYDLEESRKYWKSQEGNEKALRVKILYKLRLRLTNALFKTELQRIQTLKNLQIFKQSEGTNFKVEPFEWQTILDLLKTQYNFEL